MQGTIFWDRNTEQSHFRSDCASDRDEPWCGKCHRHDGFCNMGIYSLVLASTVIPLFQPLRVLPGNITLKGKWNNLDAVREAQFLQTIKWLLIMTYFIIGWFSIVIFFSVIKFLKTLNIKEKLWNALLFLVLALFPMYLLLGACK